MMQLARSAALACAVLLAGGHAAAQKLEPAQSEIAFTVRQMGVPVQGRFTRFDGQLAFDPHQPETGRIALSIDTGSARFDSPDTDGEAPKPDWLHVAKFPKATLESTAIKAVGPGKFEVAGKLAIKGSVRDVLVPVTLERSGAATVATGTFTVKRLDFRIGEGEWADTSLVANEVQVRFKFALSGMAAP